MVQAAAKFQKALNASGWFEPVTEVRYTVIYMQLSTIITGVYIDSRVDATVDENGAITYTMVNGRKETVSATYAEGTAPKLYVLTQGVQEAGFENANAALVAGFGEVTQENAQKWFNAVATGDREDIQ